ncbi:membrane protein insertion efficiency factor YidD [Bacteriovoracaceae bacterium]|nr:membrane protein insertion efficiency factor YidD [Bacteriovoracaceae bacterium]
MKVLSKFFSFILIFIIKIYQWLISPILGPRCRFTPSCSNYVITSLKQDNLWVAIRKSTKRILSCHPFHPGGFDPP